MNIILDCDGVLLDWESGFRSWAIRKLNRPLLAQPTSWDLSKWLDVSADTAKSMIHEFNHGEEFGLLDPLPWAVDAVRALGGNGHKIHVITSCSRDAGVAMRRANNLAAHFPNLIDTVTCLALGESKAPYLQEHPRGVWVEDNYHGALSGFEAGHKTFMLACPHNAHWQAESHPAITWRDNWADLYALISDHAGAPETFEQKQATYGAAQ